MPSHYCRKRTKRLYLEGPFNNLNEVYNIYKQHCAENKILAFSKFYFTNYMKDNIFSIFIIKIDQCDICCGYETGQISEDDYAEHMALKNRARKEKKIDKQQASSETLSFYTSQCFILLSET